MNKKISSVTSAETKNEVSANVEVSTSSPNNAKPNVGCSFYSSDQIEEFDKVFENFRKNIKSQMEQFGKENNCRVIILNHELVAIIDIRKT